MKPRKRTVAGRLKKSRQNRKVPDRKPRALTPEALVEAVESVRRRSRPAAIRLLRDELRAARNRPAYARSASALVDWARGGSAAERRLVLDAVLSDGEPAALFTIQRISEMKRGEARPFMRDYLRAGGTLSAVATWLRSAGRVLRKHKVKTRGTAGAVVDAVEGAADWVVDTLEDGVDAILENLEAVVDALLAAGAKIVDVVRSVASWTAAQLADLFTALLEAGVALVEIMAPMFRMAYAAVARFVDALIEIGTTVVDILAEVFDKTYWAFRRITNGIIQKLGVGPYLDAILATVTGAVDRLWQAAVKAIRYVQNKARETLGAVVDWVASQGAAAMEGILRAWEVAGEALEDFYEFAKDVAVGVWEQIGEATARIGNSVHYVLDYIKEDLVPAVFNIVRGALSAGFAVASALAWTVEQAFEVTLEVVRAVLDVGTTLGVLIGNTLLNPASALDNVLRAAREIGHTVIELYEATIVETGAEFLEQVTQTLRRIGEAVRDILLAVAEVALGAIGAVIAILLNTLASYRPLSSAERADARSVFASSVDYDRVYVAQESFQNDVIFGIQELLSGNEESRAFVTNSLINFDVDERLERHTLIHEMTHVWQAQNTGAFYLTEAIHAQITEGYNYGYDEGGANIEIPIDHEGTTDTFRAGEVTGEGAQDALTDAGGDFESFNREQQGQIMMHYFVRRELLGQPPADYAAWQPYVDAVRAA